MARNALLGMAQMPTLQYRPETQVESLGKATQAVGGLQNIQIRQMEMEKAKQDAAMLQQFRQTMMQAGKNPDPSVYGQALIQTGRPDLVTKGSEIMRAVQSEAALKQELGGYQNRLAQGDARGVAQSMAVSPTPGMAQRAGALARTLPPQEKPVDTRPKPEKVQLGDRVVFLDMNPSSPTFRQEVISQKVGAAPEKPVDTRPKPEKVQLGDRVVFLDMNPSSPTFRQEVISQKVGAAPESPGAAEARRINEFRAGLEEQRLQFQREQAEAQRLRDEARARRDDAAAARAQTALDQAERRIALADETAARAADPEFQARMERARTMAAAVAKDDAALLSQGPSALEAGQRTLALLNRMVGDPKGQGAAAQPHPGFTGTIGMTFTPGMRFVPGTPESDFSAMLEQVQGGAFLEAYERLKGTGQITEIEGKKATQAITRMNTAVSEQEFMQAAKEFREAIETAMNRTQTRMGKAQRGAPGRGAAAPNAGDTVTPEARQQALEWLKQNPNDPRAAQIKQRLGM